MGYNIVTLRPVQYGKCHADRLTCQNSILLLKSTQTLAINKCSTKLTGQFRYHLINYYVSIISKPLQPTVSLFILLRFAFNFCKLC